MKRLHPFYAFGAFTNLVIGVVWWIGLRMWEHPLGRQLGFAAIFGFGVTLPASLAWFARDKVAATPRDDTPSYRSAPARTTQPLPKAPMFKALWTFIETNCNRFWNVLDHDSGKWLVALVLACISVVTPIMYYLHTTKPTPLVAAPQDRAGQIDERCLANGTCMGSLVCRLRDAGHRCVLPAPSASAP